AGLGLAAISLLIFALASAGMVSSYTGWALLGICLLVGGRRAFDCLAAVWQAAREKWRGASAADLSALAFVSLSLALLVPAAYVPPLDYDTLEYHLQLPREYLEIGQARFLPHNLFSAFPQGMEMLTLLCLALARFSPPAVTLDLAGVWMAQLVHLAFLPLLLLAAGLTAARLCPKAASTSAERPHDKSLTAGLFAAALVMACGQTSALCLATPLYVEIGLTAFLCLAALGVIIAWQAAAGSAAFARVCCLVGLCAGAAANCKYPGLLFAGAPVCFLLLMAPAAGWRQRALGAALAGTFCWLVLSPWLARNALATGNPLYPLWNQRWGVKDWSEAQEERFVLAHRSADHSHAAFLAEARRVFMGGEARYVARDGKTTTLQVETLGALCLLLWPGLLFWPRQRGQSGLTALVFWLALG
ncbi:MAG: hypothetical protein N3A66_10935, partial [Planctomycetota bacterium]|nr:hypothetical protein [Planctomycetota bacterium]